MDVFLVLSGFRTTSPDQRNLYLVAGRILKKMWRMDYRYTHAVPVPWVLYDGRKELAHV